MMMTHEEAQELLGVYALNAVDGDERTQLEDHVQDCVRCSSELDSLRNAATAMGNVGEPASEELWQRISERLYDNVDSEVPPIRALELPTAVISPLAARRAATSRRTKYTIATFAVAAAALVGVLSINLVRAESHVTQLNTALSAADKGAIVASLESAPGHVNVSLDGAHSAGLAKFVLLNGRGYLVSSNMTALKSGQTYQLWGIINGRPISIGLMGSANPTNVSFTIAGAKGLSELAVTVEPAGGSTVPTSPVVASGTVTA